MSTIQFDENRYFCEYLCGLLDAQEFKTFQCLLADNGHSLNDFVDMTVDALMPPPNLVSYFEAVQKYIKTGEMT